MPQKTFLSCDWGTSHFRLRLVDTDSLAVLAEIKTEQGAGQIARETSSQDRPQRFEEIWREHAARLLAQAPSPADTCVISGMASSNIGWTELPYARTPLQLNPEGLTLHSFPVRVTETSELRIILISGICSDDDVMRGEESELLGLLELVPGLDAADAWVVMPGTHSKHIRLERGRLTGFTTYMTGELYAHLRSMPTLRASLADEKEFSTDDFLQGVDRGAQTGLATSLFKTRTRSILSDVSQNGPSFLSGLLIGAELASLHAGKDLVYLCSSASLAEPYLLAAGRCGLPMQVVPSEIMAQAIVRAHRILLP